LVENTSKLYNGSQRLKEYQKIVKTVVVSFLIRADPYKAKKAKKAQKLLFPRL